MRVTHSLGVALGIALAVGPAGAQDPPAFEVVAVPWVGTTPHIPHDAVDGQWHYFQAVARNCDEAPEFRWDFDGDGEYDLDWAPAPDRWNLGTRYTYPAQPRTRLFDARVEGRCGEALAEAQFRIRVHVDATRAQRVNRAISNGLWLGHIGLARDPERRTARVTEPGCYE